MFWKIDKAELEMSLSIISVYLRTDTLNPYQGSSFKEGGGEGIE